MVYGHRRLVDQSDLNGMNDGASLLAIGDIHLGTSCSGVPDWIASRGVDPRDLTPAAALRVAVDLAIENGLDAVLFAGDVVESTNARFEAIMPLEKSVRRLIDAGIEVIAVAGNHDVEALPRLAALVEGFTLLGAGGRWEARTISKNGSPVAQVVGWSFGQERVRQSPVAELLTRPLSVPSSPVPRIGLLHADLNASGGPHAPVGQAELDDADCDAWLLGHVHKPSLESLAASTESRPSGYLGSLVGLDPSETGPHGPWLLRVSNAGDIDISMIPLAPLRWEQVAVRVDGIEHVDDVGDRLMGEAERLVRRLGAAAPLPLAVGLRAQLTGPTTCYEDIRQWIARGEWKSMGRVVDGTAVFFNKVIDWMGLRLDLAQTASGDDPAALLARRLLMLGRNDDESKALLDQARTKLAEVARDHVWQPVQEHRNATDPLSDDALRDVLFRAGKAALNAMLFDRERDQLK